MFIIKHLVEPLELKEYRILNSRMILNPKEKLHYLNLEKGNEGEKNFNSLLCNLPGNFLVVNDILLEKNNTFFQIDTLLFFQNNIYLCDVKNYEGDYFIKEQRWYSVATGKEIQSPLTQVSRCISLFRRYLQDLDINFPVKEFLIFINPEFTLYEAPRHQSIVHPTQVNRFMNQLKSIPSKLNDHHFKLAEQIVKDHVKVNPYKKLPYFEFKQLKKGVTCKSYCSFMKNVGDKEMICKVCGYTEGLESAIMRSVGDLRILFPKQKIVQEWCNLQISKKAVRRILMKYLTVRHHGRYSYYVFPPYKNN
ncbi:nuclease-related domain-containing protein [Lederbergia panacisoli]|uniref:nuclease-related domain-containing protein n=1 Tax=Lederbergia panacisoli TaxID=1255251 RepID=UPI00214B3446|nr:nuclease-related domain-containing protein [Lederbergia panacisoli]MCR2821341.1 NERD domain-containing protein [Lederbergia panacisoli]